MRLSKVRSEKAGRAAGRRRAAVLAAVVLALPSTVAVAGDLRFERLGSDRGLSQLYVIAIAQDAQGFLWFGTGNGLNRYDGYRFRVFQHDPDDAASLSSDVINAIAADPSGDLWAGTMTGGLCRFRHDTESFVCHRHDPEDATSLAQDAVWSVLVDREGGVWVGTLDQGISYLSPTRRATADPGFRHYRHDPRDPESLGGNQILSLYQDSHGDVWIGTRGAGLNRLDPESGRFVRYRHDPDDPTSLGDDAVRAIYEDRRGRLWIGTESGGLNRFDRDGGGFVRYGHDPADPSSVGDGYVRAISEDPLGRLWVSTLTHGVDLFDPETGRSTRFRHDPTDPHSLAHDAIMSSFVDRQGLLWIGGRGLTYHDPRTSAIRRYRHHAGDPHSLSDDQVFAFHRDEDGTLWVGTEFGGLNRLDPESGRFTSYPHDPGDPRSVGHDKILSILRDRQGVLWVGTEIGLDAAVEDGPRLSFRHAIEPERAGGSIMDALDDGAGGLWLASFGGGLLHYRPETGEIRRHVIPPDESRGADEFMQLLVDRLGRLWIATWGDGLALFDEEEETFTLFRHDPADPGSLSDDYVSCLVEDDDGVIWVGTGQRGFGELVELDAEAGTARFRRYRGRDGLSNEDVYSLLPDGSGRIWIGTNDGLDRFDPRTGAFTVFTAQDGLQDSELNERAAYRDADGTLYFGSPGGFNAFSPGAFWRNETPPPVVLTDFLLFNRSLPIGSGSLLQHSIGATDELVLSHRDTVFAFEFTALNYRQPERNRYAYRLEGFEDEWIEVSSRDRKAVFTAIPHGRYTFRVRASNDDGVWNETGARLSLVITPPWWKTWWAKSLYALLLLTGVPSIFLWRIRQLESRQRELEKTVAARTAEIVQQKEHIEGQAASLREANEKLLELDRFKEGLMGMIVHDLKNPLNAVLGFSDSDPPDRVLRAVRESGSRMLRMVDDILDVQRFESARMILDRQALSLRAVAASAVGQVETLARSRRIGIRDRIPARLGAHADPALLERVLVNLLTNALKFTPNGGIVSLDGRELDEQRVEVSVSDTGTGIPADKQHLIFEKFGQIEARDSGRARSTGLGLAFCRLAVEAHGGEIRVESEPGSGATFSLTLPRNVVAEGGREATAPAPGAAREAGPSEAERASLRACARELAGRKVYEVSALMALLERVDADPGSFVERWKRDVETAIRTCDEERFERLTRV